MRYQLFGCRTPGNLSTNIDEILRDFPRTAKLYGNPYALVDPATKEEWHYQAVTWEENDGKAKNPCCAEWGRDQWRKNIDIYCRFCGCPAPVFEDD